MQFKKIPSQTCLISFPNPLNIPTAFFRINSTMSHPIENLLCFCIERRRALQWITMVNHGYPFGFWISMDKWLSISDVCKYLFLNQILSDKMHIVWKFIYFCIDSWIKFSEIGYVSRNIRSFLITTNWIVLKFFNSFVDCYKDFKRKTKRKSLWMDLRNPWTNFMGI